MSLAEMKGDLPTTCNVGTKRNSKGYKTSWNGISFILTRRWRPTGELPAIFGFTA